MKRLLGILGLVFVVLVCLLFLPGGYYVRQALVHGTPDIDDYRFFENKEVKACSPEPWLFDPGYSKNELPSKFDSAFAKYETVAFLIIKDSVVYSEKYWDSYNEHSLSNSFSMAKSIVSLLVGCALDDGFIKNIDQPVCDFLPELTNLNDTTLTIRSLLTMSAATNWEEAHSSLFTMTTEAYYGKDLWALMTRMKLKAHPGVQFEYQSGVTQLLAFVLQKAVGKSLSDYASEKLWTPIHAESNALWSLDHAGGMEKAYCCFNTNARDFARLGQLVLNHGRWGDRQVVSRSYIDQAIMPASGIVREDNGVSNTFYGFQFWILHYRGMAIPYMRGILGQYIFIIPEKNVVVVRLGNKRSTHYSEPNHCTDDAYLWLDAALEMIK